MRREAAVAPDTRHTPAHQPGSQLLSDVRFISSPHAASPTQFEERAFGTAAPASAQIHPSRSAEGKCSQSPVSPAAGTATPTPVPHSPSPAGPALTSPKAQYPEPVCPSDQAASPNFSDGLEQNTRPRRKGNRVIQNRSQGLAVQRALLLPAGDGGGQGAGGRARGPGLPRQGTEWAGAMPDARAGYTWPQGGLGPGGTRTRF